MLAIKIGLTVFVVGFAILLARCDVKEPDPIGRVGAWMFLGGLVAAAIGFVWSFLP